MQLGFDEVYLLIEKGLIRHNEVLYDSRTADEKVEWLMRNGSLEVVKMPLEEYFERIDPQ